MDIYTMAHDTFACSNHSAISDFSEHVNGIMYTVTHMWLRYNMPMAERKQNVMIYAWHETMYHYILLSPITSTYTPNNMFMEKHAYRENQSCVSTGVTRTHITLLCRWCMWKYMSHVSNHLTLEREMRMQVTYKHEQMSWIVWLCILSFVDIWSRASA